MCLHLISVVLDYSSSLKNPSKCRQSLTARANYQFGSGGGGLRVSPEEIRGSRWLATLRPSVAQEWSFWAIPGLIAKFFKTEGQGTFYPENGKKICYSLYLFF